MSTNARIGLCAVALLALGACSSSKTAGDPDSGITFDATPPPDGGFPDTTPPEDGGSGPSGDVGKECTSDDDCGGAVCQFDVFGRISLPGGYCSLECTTDADCPEGSGCGFNFRGPGICLDRCEIGGTDQCRPGYGCSGAMTFAPGFCLPGCEDATDCDGDLDCDPNGGFLAGACYDPSSSVGDACTTEEDCPVAGFCLAEDDYGYPGGACATVPDCDYVNDTGCPEGDVCLGFAGGFGGELIGVCIAGCATAEDCRAGYDCEADADTGRLVCTPGCDTNADCSGGRVCNPAVGTCDVPFSAGDLGRACSNTMGAVCAGGTCLSEFESGQPGSNCVYLGCDSTAADAADGCPGTGVCADGADGLGVCYDGCASDDDCRPGYGCKAVDPDNAERGTGCFPACTAETVCANDGMDGAPLFTCNPGTGLCGEPFVAANLGEPCENADQCPGGRCLSEAEAGWPAGTCQAVGCRLSGEGPDSPCPEGGVCVDDGEGDAALGACLPACVTDTTSCRPGYACVALVDGETAGACRPACTETSCGSSRTCNGDTGLCE